MPYRQITEFCFQEAVGPNGISPETFSPLLERTGEAIEKIGLARREGDNPLFLLPSWQDDVSAMSQLAGTMRDTFSHIVVLGTGGSSLGGQALAALAHPTVRARVVFPDNLDGPAFATLLDGLDMARTCFLVVSKSGGTPETLSQALVALGAIREATGDEGVRGRLLVITEPGDNPLRRLAEYWSLSVLDHDANLGGRYSVLSLVGLLPAMVLGLDVLAVRRGASHVLEATIAANEPGEAPAAVGAAISVAAFRQGIGTTVILPYCNDLERFGAWHRQLWAESLGKQGRGSLPVPALGPVDQHSQLQLYLDGPADKLFTLIVRDDEGAGPAIPTELADGDEALNYLAGRTIGDLVAAEARATAETLVRCGRPTRTIRVSKLDEETMGALLMHFMLETIIAAHLLDVDPFDQPAVEAGKVLARKYLKEMATAGGLQ